VTEYSQTLVAANALLPDGWARDVYLEITADGRFASVTPNSQQDGAPFLPGAIIPGMPNVHSHAFQRALAGRVESLIDGADSFWSWRSGMYALANTITPDDCEAIATQVYVEMLEAGYTSVGEFNYVHHDRDGTPFAVRSEMAQRLLSAAETAGIGITLLPVFYRWSGFGRAEPLPEQRRFVTDIDTFAAMLDELRPLCATPTRRLGIAPHSLRAVTLDDLRDVISALDSRDVDAPIHMHLAEQTAEVDACVSAYGLRPAAWLCEHVALSPRWCAIHATHLTAAEMNTLASTGTTVGVTPTTEANLGDGIFALQAWTGAGGALAIGSDSHVSVNVTEELRWLEYIQRLKTQRRTISESPEALYVAAARGGARALGRPIGNIAAGARADFVVLDPSAPSVAGHDVSGLLDRYVTTGGRGALREVYCGGRRVVADGRHLDRERIAARYRLTQLKCDQDARRIS
jgi:formimidoylglutamate deiminase